MGENPRAIVCPRCKQPLQASAVAGRADLGACSQCGKRVLMNGCYQEAMALATANEGWVEKVFWSDQTDALLPSVIAFAIDLPLTILKYVGPVFVLLSMIFLFEDPFTASPGMSWRVWLLIPASVLAAFLVFRMLKWGLERMLPNQFVTQANFIVSSRGIILVVGRAHPFLLPWSAILDYTWSSQVQNLTSQISIKYAAADQGVGPVVLDGEEKRQPLGELYEILEARLGQRVNP